MACWVLPLLSTPPEPFVFPLLSHCLRERRGWRLREGRIEELKIEKNIPEKFLIIFTSYWLDGTGSRHLHVLFFLQYQS